MKRKSPIQRSEALKHLSRDHHHALLLCWKIRQGLKKKVSPNRMRLYVQLFYHEHLAHHFWEEEHHLFPLIDANDQYVKRAVKEHRRLERLILSEPNDVKAIHLIEEELEAHVRFEERTLFHLFQKNVPEHTLMNAMNSARKTDANALEHWPDKFWE